MPDEITKTRELIDRWLTENLAADAGITATARWTGLDFNPPGFIVSFRKRCDNQSYQCNSLIHMLEITSTNVPAAVVDDHLTRTLHALMDYIDKGSTSPARTS